MFVGVSVPKYTLLEDFINYEMLIWLLLAYFRKTFVLINGYQK